MIYRDSIRAINNFTHAISIFMVDLANVIVAHDVDAARDHPLSSPEILGVTSLLLGL